MVYQEKYQLPVHQSICEPMHSNSPHASEITWQYIAFNKSLMAEWLKQAFSDMKLLLWSGGRGFEPLSGRTWGV